MKSRVTVLAESLEKTKEQTEKAWLKLKGNGSDPYHEKSLRRYCAGLRLMEWLRAKLKQV